MAIFKNIVKSLTPPLILTVLNHLRMLKKEQGIWSGNYKSWDEAKNLCKGYASELILEKCKNALLEVKNGNAVYERDGVIFDDVQYSWPLLAALQKCAIENVGELRVLDFGGSLGSTYYQNRKFLATLKKLEWFIVEQQHFVDCGKAYFEDEQLKFYHTLEECLKKHKPNVLVLSSVLQYLPDPFEWIRKFIALKIPFIVIDRTGFILNQDTILTIQNVPEEIYKASYPCWFFNENKFLELFLATYDIVSSSSDNFTSPIQIDGGSCFWKGYYLKMK
jgi:putative methyltransferase (TIGR04325 family)